MIAKFTNHYYFEQYDFTEERRVIAECKMWEEYKEKERLAREEEERIRQLAEAEEQLRLKEQERLEREEAEAAGINNLIAQAELGSEESSETDREKFIDQEISKLNLHTLPNNSEEERRPVITGGTVENDDSTVRASEEANTSGGVNGESAGNSYLESPTSEDNSVSSQSHSQSQPMVQTEVKDTIPPAAPVGMISQTPYPIMNGYQYNYPMYHQQQYYNYYMAVAPTPHVQYTPQAPTIPQPTGPIYPPQQMHYQPVHGVAQAPPAAPPMATPVVAPPAVPTPTESSAVVTPSGHQSGGELSNKNSGTSTPTGDSDKSLSATSPASVTASSTAINQKVDLKDLSYFENDTTNPFDNVELKSINDMEVLASVLKNHAPPTEGARPEPQAQSTVASSSYSQSNGGPGNTSSMYYHQPTPLYPPASTQCPYPTWNTPQQNGYYHAPPTSIAPIPRASHIPSPTQAVDSQQPNTSATTATTSAPVTSTTEPTQSPTVTSVNSFTKLTFPFLTSMDAASSRYTRNPNGPTTGSHVTPHHSQDDIVSHNPFLSRYVQSSPQQHRPHQYWPSHLTQQQHGPPYTSAISNGAMAPLVHHHHLNHLASTSPISSPTPSTTGPSPATAASHHAMR